MKTKAVRLHGANDLRLEEFDLPAIKDDEILARVVSDSICMSSHKAAVQGASHKRVPNDITENPIIIGHEFCGELLEIGTKWRGKFNPGDKFAIQPAINDPKNIYAVPGYSFKYIGGAATYIVIPSIVMEQGCLLKYTGNAYFYGSLVEPVSCIIGGFNVNYHTETGNNTHIMGIKENGKMAILGGTGPMGLGAVDYALNGPRRPAVLTVTETAPNGDERLKRAKMLYSPEYAAERGVKLTYLHASDPVSSLAELRSIANGGYDDVFVYAPFSSVVEQADALLRYDGCLNFFSGPSDPQFTAKMNFYNVHYLLTHITGNSGGTTKDMTEALDLMAKKTIDPVTMITHVGGLNAAAEATINLKNIRAGKILIYNHINMPLTAISDMSNSNDPLIKELSRITAQNNNLWCEKAEKFLLDNTEAI